MDIVDGTEINPEGTVTTTDNSAPGTTVIAEDPAALSAPTAPAPQVINMSQVAPLALTDTRISMLVTKLTKEMFEKFAKFWPRIKDNTQRIPAVEMIGVVTAFSLLTLREISLGYNIPKDQMLALFQDMTTKWLSQFQMDTPAPVVTPVDSSPVVPPPTPG